MVLESQEGSYAMSTQSLPPRVSSREPPSKVTKDRLTQILQQEIHECGRVAKQMCQQSGSREVGVAGGGGKESHEQIRVQGGGCGRESCKMTFFHITGCGCGGTDLQQEIHECGCVAKLSRVVGVAGGEGGICCVI